MFTQPRIDERPAQHYMGIRLWTPMHALPQVIPQLVDEMFGWLQQQGIEPAGPPLQRFHIINMETELEIEIGVLVAAPVAGDERVKPGIIPAGRYASLIYTGVQNGIPGNGLLIDWAKENGIEFDTYPSDKGDGFTARVEYFLEGPEDDPDPATWDNEVAIKIAD